MRESLKQLLHYFWGTIVHPGATFNTLAAQHTLRWALMLATLPILQVWGNIVLHSAFGLDWLGTRPILTNPTFIAGFGHWRIELTNWVPIFAALMPLLVLLGLVIVSGVVQLVSKLWQGQGTFEQTVNGIAFATIVPSMVIGATSEWLFGVPVDLLFSHPYWWNAAIQGELGEVIGAVWNFYVIGIYVTFQYGWQIVLGSIAIRRIHRIPTWAATLSMVVAFGIMMFIHSIFVR